MTGTLGEILQEQFGVSESQLNEIRMEAAARGASPWRMMVKKGVVTEKQLMEAYKLRYRLPLLEIIPIDRIRLDVTRKVSIQFLKRHMMVPFDLNGDGNKAATDEEHSDSDKSALNQCAIAVSEPDAFPAMEDLILAMGLSGAQPVLAPSGAIVSAINLAYDLSRDSAEQLVQDMEKEEEFIIADVDGATDLLDDTSDAPIIRLVNHILSQSIKARASDIHVESYQEQFKIRYRVDGILHDFLTPPKRIQSELISRIKVLARMDIAEKRLPQDGRLNIRIGDQEIDVRVSTLPTSFGERVVLRLLNKSGSLLTVSELGMEPATLETVLDAANSPNGVMLVTGPTGSGKTTTLYAVLSSINSPDINIITIEDPVEYQLNGISQIQVRPKIGLTFAKGLRSIVRQDPDVILVGEIRDGETAEIAVQSALTGHRVFSTLHTNDSAGAITRLVDVGVEPFLIASSVLAVAAQRLVRTLCPKCKRPMQPGGEMIETVGLSDEELKSAVLCQAAGCDYCMGNGYRGRLGIFEILPMDDEMKGLIVKTQDANRIKHAAIAGGMVTLQQDGLVKVMKGVTTFEEIWRVTQK